MMQYFSRSCDGSISLAVVYQRFFLARIRFMEVGYCYNNLALLQSTSNASTLQSAVCALQRIYLLSNAELVTATDLMILCIQKCFI